MDDRLSRQSYILDNGSIVRSSVLVICSDHELLFELCRHMMCIGFMRILLVVQLSDRLVRYKSEFFNDVVIEVGDIDNLKSGDVCVLDGDTYDNAYDVDLMCYNRGINFIFSSILWDKSLSMVFVRSTLSIVSVTGDAYDESYVITEVYADGYKCLPVISNGSYLMCINGVDIQCVVARGCVTVERHMEVGDRFFIKRPSYNSSHVLFSKYIDKVVTSGNRYWDAYLYYAMKLIAKEVDVDLSRVHSKLNMSCRTNDNLIRVSHSSNVTNSICSCFSDLLHIDHQLSFIPLLCKTDVVSKQYSILQIGCGATGCESAYLLCSIGQKNIILCDYDKFSYTNRNRQFLCSNDDIGENKAKVCARRLSEMFSIDVKYLDMMVCDSNHEIFEPLFNTVDIIICTVDNVNVRRYISYICKYYGKYMFECGTNSQFNSTYYYDPNVISHIYSFTSRKDQIASSLNCSPKSYCMFFSHCVRSSVDFFDRIFAYGKRLTAEEAFDSEYSERHSSLHPIPDHLVPYVKKIDCVKYGNYNNGDFTKAYDTCTSGEFNKDNKDHINMIIVMTKIKCQLFGIEFVDDRNVIRRIAGHITPSIISSSSCASSQMISQLFNIDSIQSHSYDMCKNSYATYSLSRAFDVNKHRLIISPEVDYYGILDNISAIGFDVTDLEYITMTNDKIHFVLPKVGNLHEYCDEGSYRCTLYSNDVIVMMLELLLERR